jgi:predicted alpha/beta superfamily hydrolase
MRLFVPALAAALACSSAAVAQAPATSPKTPVTVSRSQQVDFTAKANGKAYRLFIATPLTPPPPGGYPVVYVLDGNAYFGSVTEATRARSALGSEIAGAVIVGIGYPTDNLMTMLGRRFYDLTPVPPTAAEREKMEGSMKMMGVAAIEYAGADVLLDIIETEIKPMVGGMLPVDPKRSVLFGHSIGGLAVVNALFKRPSAFDAYIAISPSIWWADRDILKGERAFATKLGGLSPRVFIGVGSLEQAVPAEAPPGMTLEQAAKYVADVAMVDNAVALGKRLSALKGGPGYKVVYRVFEGETHGSVPWATFKPAFDLALPVPRAAKP